MERVARYRASRRAPFAICRKIRLKAWARSVVVLAAAIPPLAAAQADFPNRTLRLIVPYAAGGSGDIVARLLALKLGERLGQNLVVENRGGAGGLIGHTALAQAAPDGYTLILSGTALALFPYTHKNIPFDPIKDFAAVGLISHSPFVLSVNQDIPAATLASFIAYAKERPGRLNYATPGLGTINHLAGEYFQVLTDTKMTHVPYKGGSPAITATLAGETQLILTSVINTYPQVKAGKLKALAVGSKHRLPMMPDVPTLAEAGVPLEAGVIYSLLAPAGTPAPVIGRLNRELALVLKDKEVLQKMSDEGSEILGGPPENLTAYLQDALVRWGAVLKGSNIKLVD